eukprot:EW709489.1.p2 GENE.EW709489.1~~EW709489.1.p2  ORF type:complete len:129 (+),score=48.64 EW709489.1:1-387(+)
MRNDELNLKEIQAKNDLEAYVFNVRNTMDEPNLKDKITSEDREKLQKLLDEAFQFLDDHANPANEESFDIFSDKQKALEKEVMPIFSKLYQEAGAAAPGGAPGGAGFPGAGPAPGGAAPGGPSSEDLD